MKAITLSQLSSLNESIVNTLSINFMLDPMICYTFSLIANEIREFIAVSKPSFSE
jgi:hypothetical protein